MLRLWLAGREGRRQGRTEGERKEERKDLVYMDLEEQDELGEVTW